MKDFFKGFLLFPIKTYGKLIPSLPDSIHDFNIWQRLFVVLSIPFYYTCAFVLLVLIFDNTDPIGLMAFIAFSFFPVPFYYGVIIAYKGLSFLLNFILGKDANRIKDKFKSASGKINSQLILRYLLILLVIVIIVVILIGAFR
tara:strand:+ start:139 stop:567 length:429 start_codon:yes stop_codon:yes gene_type:complete